MKNTFKLFYSTLFLLFAINISFAQDLKPSDKEGDKMKCCAKNENCRGRLKIGILAGTALPFGSFSHSNTSALSYAKMGGVAGLDLSYTVWQNWEIALSGNYFMNAVDANKLAEGIWNENKTASNVKVSDVTPYNMRNVMLGIRPYVPLFGKNLSAFAGFSGGMLFAKTPSFTREVALSSPLIQEIKGATSSAFCYQVQGGLQYNLGCKAALSLFADYLSSKPSFEFVRNDKSGTPTETISQHIQNVNIGLKFSYALSNGKCKDKS